MEQVTLVLLNVTIILSESPLCYIQIKKTTRRKKDQALRWKYDAIEATFEWHEEGASGYLLNVWQKTYMECQICKKHVCFKSRKSMSSLSCCIDFHDDLMYDLGFMDRVELFGVKNSQFKKADAMEVRKNKIHMKKLMTIYEEDLGDMD